MSLHERFTSETHNGETTLPVRFGNVFFLHVSDSLKDTSLKLLAGSMNYAILAGNGDINEIEVPDYSNKNLTKRFGQLLADELQITLYQFNYTNPHEMMFIIPTAQLILSSFTGKNTFKGNLPFGMKQITKTSNPQGREPNKVAAFTYQECSVDRLVVGHQEILTFRFWNVSEICYKVSVDTSVVDYKSQLTGSEERWKDFCRHVIPALSLVLVAETDITSKAPFVHKAIQHRYTSTIKCILPSDRDSVLKLHSDLDRYGEQGRSRARKAAIRALKQDLGQFRNWHTAAEEQQKSLEQVMVEELDRQIIPPRASPPPPPATPPGSPGPTTISSPQPASSPPTAPPPPPPPSPQPTITSSPPPEPPQASPEAHRAVSAPPAPTPRKIRRLSPLAASFVPGAVPVPSSPTPTTASASASIIPIAPIPEVLTDVDLDLSPHEFDYYAHHICRHPDCGRLTLSYDPTSLCCPWCGPLSYIRYCGPQHLLEDVYGHFAECGLLPLPGPVKLNSLERRHLPGGGLVWEEVGLGLTPEDRIIEIGRALRKAGVNWVWREWG